MNRNVHGLVASTIVETASLDRLEHSDQGSHRKRSTRRISSRFLNIFGEKTAQTQRDVEAVMTELGWIDDATAE